MHAPITKPASTYVDKISCALWSFILAKNFEGETGGTAGLMGCPSSPRGWVREGDVPPPAQSTKA